MGTPLHFLQASDTSDLTALRTERGSLPGQYAALLERLKALGLERWGTLWAEPVTGAATPEGYASVSWYTPLDGAGTPLSRLDAAEARQARAELRRAREALAPHLDEAPDGALLRKALFIPSADNVFVVNGHPVLINWGFLPPGTDESTAPILWGGTEEETPASVPPRAASALGVPAAVGVPAVGAETIVRRNGRGLLLALLMGFLLGALLLFLPRACAPKSPLPPPPASAPAESPEEAGRRAERDDLLREKAFWQSLLELSPCDARAFFASGGEAAAGKDAPAAPDKTTPESPAPGGAVPGLRLPPLPDAEAAAPAQPVDLSALTVPQRIERGTVLILAPVPGGAQQGTGFFVNDDHVLTNRHVVMNAIGDQVVIVNAAFPGARRGTVVAVSDEPGFDFAVVRAALAPGERAVPLPLCAAISRTDKVSAWGFPALVSEQDPAYLRLLGGDFDAVPEIVYTDGVVNAILQTKPRNIVHSAVVSQGNSGGPLVNEKGQVVGINTFIRLDADSNRQTQTALGSDAVMDFLRGKGIPFTEERPLF